MEGSARVRAQAEGEFTEEAVAALRALHAGEHPPLLLAYHPVAHLNPYQRLLYQQAWKAGIGPVPLADLSGLVELEELARAGMDTLLHLHWINMIMGEAGSESDARKAGVAFLAQLDRYREAGGRVAWTVHNVLPHDARFDAEEAWLRGEVASRADVIHTLASDTVEQVAPYFTIPRERVLNVPHSSYLGAYEDFFSREQARHELGIMPGELAFLAMGAIKPYKGFTDLLDAWDALEGDGVARRLVIAGRPGEGDAVEEMMERAALHPTVLLHARAIPAGEMQVFLRAADLAVMPYLRTLNSGAQLLALTFGLPVILPSDSGLVEHVDDRCARTFDPEVPGDLVAVLRNSASLATPGARAAALEIAASRAPAALSERFAFGMRAMLDRGKAPASEA